MQSVLTGFEEMRLSQWYEVPPRFLKRADGEKERLQPPAHTLLKMIKFTKVAICETQTDNKPDPLNFPACGGLLNCDRFHKDLSLENLFCSVFCQRNAQLIKMKTFYQSLYSPAVWILADPWCFLLASLACFFQESLDSQNLGLLCYGNCFGSEQLRSSGVSPLN